MKRIIRHMVTTLGRSGEVPGPYPPPSGFLWDYLVDNAGQQIVDFAGNYVVALVAA